MLFDVFARQPHYQRHLTPIIGELEARGHTQDRAAPVVLCAGRTDAARLGRQGRTVVLVEHGAGQTYVLEDGRRVDASGENPDPNVRLYLGPRAEVCEFMRTMLPGAECRVIGSPVVERLLSQRRHPQVVVFAVHWQSGLKVKEAGSSWPWSMQIIEALSPLEDRLTVTAHPRIVGRVRVQLTRRNIGVRIVEDWDSLAPRTSVLVCDNSSIMWEADALGIPVVLIDPPGWRKGVHGLRFGPEADRFVRVSDPGRVLAAVGNAELFPPSFPGSVYDILGGAAAAAADAIEEVCGG